MEEPVNRVTVRACIVIAVILSLSAAPMRAAPIPAPVKDCVTFIFLQDSTGRLVPQGTAFFVQVPSETDKKAAFVYMVSAGHVLRDDSGKLHQTVCVRLNKKGDGSDFLKLDLGSMDKRRILQPDDPAVDLIAVNWAPSHDEYDFKVITPELLSDKAAVKELKIQEGTDVFFTGLFTPHVGQKRNYPISRFGRVALLPEEPVAWGKKKDGTDDFRELYLLETQSFGGNSGSPVFFFLGSDREAGSIMVGPPVLKLAGVMQGTFMDAQELIVIENSGNRIPASRSSVGIAAVVPSYLLKDLLTGEKAKALRVSLEGKAVASKK